MASKKSAASKRASFFISQQSIETLNHYDSSYQPKLLKDYTRDYTGTDGTEFDITTESRVLVLYTGGTIGMRVHNGAYEPEPNFLVDELRKLPMFYDKQYADAHFTENEEYRPLVMPLSKDGKRVIYYIYEYEPLLDSCNMTMTDYARIGVDIQTNYNRFDAFIILHGTDTMAYTASALSFMLEHLGKTVILTGAQIPIFETRSDGRDNFLGALFIAGHYNIPEVTLYFDNKLLRGNRSTKADSEAFAAFVSPNIDPLLTMEINVNVHWESIYKSSGAHKFHVQANLSPNVGLLRLFPSITTATVKAFLRPPMKGAVLQTYGAGNAPSNRKDLMDALKEATDSGILIINITQCSKGMVTPSYETGKALIDAGVIPGSDMTPEAALTKLAYVLGKAEWSHVMKKKMLSVNLRGEMTVSIQKDLSMADFSLIEHLTEAMKLSSKSEIRNLRSAVFPSLMCAAAKAGDLQVLDTLKRTGGVFDSTDYDGRSPLHVAASRGHFNTVNYLLENGASVHLRDMNGDSPLASAVRQNNYRVIDLLRLAGAHLMIPPQRIGIELCLAAFNGNTAHLKSWMLGGADINLGDYDKRTALHVACSKGHMGTAAFLLENGADPFLKDVFGMTSFDEASRRGSQNMLTLLKDSKIAKQKEKDIENEDMQQKTKRMMSRTNCVSED